MMPRASPTVRRRLFTLLAAVAVPLLMLIVGAMLYAYEGQRSRAEQLLLAHSQSFASAIGREVARRSALVVTLAGSPALARDDMDGFRLQMDVASAGVGRNAVSLASEDGRLLESSQVPPGAVLAGMHAAPNVTAAVRADRPLVTAVYVSPLTGQTQIAVAMAVAATSGPNAHAFVSIALPAETVTHTLGRFELPPGWNAWVVDHQGNVLAGGEAASLPAPSGLVPPELGTNESQLVRGLQLGGADTIAAWSEAAGSGLLVAVTVPSLLFTQPLQTAIARVVAAGIAIAAAGLLLGLVTVRGISAAIRKVPLAAATGASLTGLLETDALAMALSEARSGRDAADGRATTLSALAAQSSDLIALMNPDHAITYLNEAGLRMIGLEKLGAHRLHAFLVPEDRGFFENVITATRLKEGAWRGRFRLRHMETGTIIPVDCNVFSLRPSPEGEVTAYATVTRDISAQTAAETALREREAQLARVQRIGNVGGFEVDLRGSDFPSWRSPEYQRLHGLVSGGEYERHADWARRVHPDDRVATERHFLATIESEAIEYACEYRIVTPAGQVRWISAVAEIERDTDGRAIRIVGAHIDITASKAAEVALRESDARFRAALGAVGGTVWTNDSRGQMVGPQPGWTALTGQTETEYSGLGWSSQVHPDDVEQTLVIWNAAVADPRLVLFEHRLRMCNGRYRLFSVQAVPLLDTAGQVREWVGVHTDITAERVARDQLRQLNGDLEARVTAEVQTREATQARLAQTQRLEALGQLAGGIAHDFNNVLQAVQGGGTLILRRSGGDEATQRLVRMVLDATSRGASITRRLLAFSRRGELRAERIDTVALLADMQEILTHTLGSGIAVQVNVEPGLPELFVDKGQLETVLVNLATNARDAMADGGRLTITAATHQLGSGDQLVHDDRLRAGAYVRIVVDDTGSGMDAATLARASEPFFTTKPLGSGTGLGLAMARGFAAQSGGALTIESTLGQGTGITLWLPMSLAEATRPSPAPARQAPSGGYARILLTDDDALVRETLGEQLGEAGYVVTMAASGTQAIALLSQGLTIDLLVSDLSMLGMNGVTLIRQAQHLVPGLPAILLTGFATDAAASALGTSVAGAVSLLRKPVTLCELAERIETMLEGARQR